MKPVLLVVVDGLGLRSQTEGNAFKQASTPNLGKLMIRNGFGQLEASGPAVGLPKGYSGNSKVGHLHLGAGRKIRQRLTRINNNIEKGRLGDREKVRKTLQNAEDSKSKLHIAGIISDGGIHGHIDHLKALLEISSEYDVEVEIHCFTDGRDVAPKSADKFLNQIQAWIEEFGGEIATVTGRYYAMDRDDNWNRTEKSYRAMTEAEGFEFDDPLEALRKTYDEKEYDYFVQPSVARNYTGMGDDDQILFYNFRADRERQIAEAFLKDDFNKFENSTRPDFLSMYRYRKDFENPVVFEKQIVENTLGEKIEENGLSQLRVAESQKRPHVTFFFNGQREIKFEKEERHFIESDKIRSYKQSPEMHAKNITDVVLKAINKDEKDFILLNYANCDLVGHTGDLEAAITAVETVDRNIGRLIEGLKNTDYRLLITSDHGNCEKMGKEGDPDTSHSRNPVPITGYNMDDSTNFNMKSICGVKELIENILDLEK